MVIKASKKGVRWKKYPSVTEGCLSEVEVELAVVRHDEWFSTSNHGKYGRILPGARDRRVCHLEMKPVNFRKPVGRT